MNRCSLFGFDLACFYGALRAMGCFFGCFSVKDDKSQSQSHLVVDQGSSKNSREAVKSRNRLSSLLLYEDSLSKDSESHGFGSPQPYIVDREIKDEARFLKACGTIAESPAEFQKAVQRFQGSPSLSANSYPSTFNSWLPNTSIPKLQLIIDQPPTPSQVCEDCSIGLGSDSMKSTSCSCISNSQNTGVISSSSFEASGQESGTSINVRSNQSVDTATPVSLPLSTPSAQQRNRSVRFECELNQYLLSSSSSSSGNHGLPKPKPSPFATPLELTDEMKTPGTVFPGSLEYTKSRKNARIRSQCVYPALNHIGNLSQGNEVQEDKPNLHEPVNELEVDTSMAPSHGGPSGNPYFGRTPGDRPILSTVAAHWYEEEPQISPKMWDGNGIPNSTNKYKEDQKVSWHATPFEERLEKALSEESSVYQRKDLNRTPISSDEANEENDTAASHLQSLTHRISVITF